MLSPAKKLKLMEMPFGGEGRVMWAVGSRNHMLVVGYILAPPGIYD